ncbi:MAG: hypothetical protein A2W37_15350 [Chloroflexi bacterium RBG_16_63_12]|nr:MAG: hypothetical protein A2W37_15350 [Chloroflexi bacterium RBG_16_63_12]
MNEQQQHEMVLEKTYPAGAEEWYCPACGRRFLVEWSPAYNMIIIEPGDQYARHRGSQCDLDTEALQVEQNDEVLLAEDSRLAPWLAWLEEVDFDDLWNREVE